MTPTNPTDNVARARELLNKAAAGPWARGGRYWDKRTITHSDGKGFVADCGPVASDEDAALIAAAPELIAALADEVEQLRAHLAEFAEFHGEALAQVALHSRRKPNHD